MVDNLSDLGQGLTSEMEVGRAEMEAKVGLGLAPEEKVARVHLQQEITVVRYIVQNWSLSN